MRTYLLLFAFCLASCSAKKEAPPSPSFPVRVTTAQEKEVPIYLEALGHVESMISIDLKSRIEGELTGIYFQQGQEVKKGNLLFTIDPKPYEASLKQAEGLLEENLAKLAIAQEKVKRYQLLTKEEYYSQIDYETLQADFASSKGLVDQARAQVESAKINLQYCWIYAPIDGLMGILQIDYGNLISQDGATPLVNLSQIAPIYVTFSIPEIKLPLIQKYRKKASLQVLGAYENFSEDVFEGELDIIDNQVDKKTGMIRLRALFNNEEKGLWPGQFIRTRVILTKEPNAIVIPYTAVQLTIEGPIAFVVTEEMKVEQRSLKLGPRQDESVIVNQGLKKGERVVLEGQINLSNGAPVHILDSRL